MQHVGAGGGAVRQMNVSRRATPDDGIEVSGDVALAPKDRGTRFIIAPVRPFSYPFADSLIRSNAFRRPSGGLIEERGQNKLARKAENRLIGD